MPHSTRIGEQVQRYVTERWAERDVRARGFQIAYSRGFVADRDIANDLELAEDPFYAEFARPSGLDWFGGSAIRVNNRLVIISLFNTADQGPIERAKLEELSRLRPTIAVAVRRAAALGFRRIDAVEQAFAQAGHGVAVIDHAGRLVWLNPPAEELLGAGELTRNGYLAPADTRDAGAVRNLFNAALLAPAELLPPAPVQVHVANGDSVVLDIVPLPRDFQGLLSGAAAVMTIRRLARPNRSADGLKERFGLTAREAEIAMALTSGQTLEQIAAALGVSVATSRQHLKSIFRKTGTHRQAELVAVLSSA